MGTKHDVCCHGGCQRDHVYHCHGVGILFVYHSPLFDLSLHVRMCLPFLRNVLMMTMIWRVCVEVYIFGEMEGVRARICLLFNQPDCVHQVTLNGCVKWE